MEGHKVEVYIYDISKGLASSMSQPLLGRQINGIWHTGIVVYQSEYFYGSDGICSCPPGGTILGRPNRIESLGNTQVPYDMLMEYLQQISESTFRPEGYHLFDHNCNTFSSELAKFLTGRDIPSEITDLSSQIMNTPLGAMIRPFFDSLSQSVGGQRVSATTRNTDSNNSNILQASNETSDFHGFDAKDSLSLNVPVVFVEDISEIISDEEYKSFLDDLDPADFDKISYVERSFTDNNQTSMRLQDCILVLCKHLTDNNISRERCKFAVRYLTSCFALLTKMDCPESNLTLQSKSFNSHVTSAMIHLNQLNMKDDFIKLIANITARKDGYESIKSNTTVNNVVLDICIDSLLHEHNEPSSSDVVISAVYNLSLHMTDEDDSIKLCCAILEFLRKASASTAEKSLKALLNFSVISDQVKVIAFTVNIDWATLRHLSPDVSKLVDAFTSH